LRDGNQSLLGGSLGAAELLPLAELLDEVGFHSLEAWGGATFEAYLRRGEDPWSYLSGLRKATPKTPIQALLRGQNLVGSHNYGDDVVELFIGRARALGVDIFRVFDPLNDLRNMEAAIGYARASGARVQGALCYAISPAHTLDGWIVLGKGLGAMEVDEIVIKDTSGLLSPQATWELVTGLVRAVGLPVVVHSHCSSGMAPMSYMAAVEAGASVLDTAISPLAWGASQPAAESVVAALRDGEYDTGLDLERLSEIKVVVERLKSAHRDQMSALADRVDSDILRYQLPGATLDDVQRELALHHAEGRLAETLEEITRIRKDLGFPPLVAPVRQLVATQAVFNVLSGERYATVTQELKDYLQGLYGRPPQPPSREVRRQVLGQEDPITIRPADLIEPELERTRVRLQRSGDEVSDEQLLNHLLFPGLKIDDPAPAPSPAQVSEDASASDESQAPQPTQDTETMASAASEAPPPEVAAAPMAEFEVEVEGEVFKVRVSGRGLLVTSLGDDNPLPAGSPAPAIKPGSITAPMQGLIVKVPVQVGDQVGVGDVVAVLEAMKMQNDITTQKSGEVTAVYVSEGEVVGPHQALVHVG